MRADEVAFTEYVGARRDSVRRTAYLLCGDWYRADDLTQNVFVRLAAHWERIRDPGAMDAWVRTSLLRDYLAENRRLWRHRERNVADPPEPQPVREGEDHAVRRLTVMAALRRLTPRQRATVVCRYYQGLDVTATAVALGCSPGTVKSQTARALTALREVLGELDPELELLGGGSR